MSKEINLLPRKNTGILEKESTVFLARIIAILSVIFVASSFVTVFFLQKNYSLSALQDEQQAVQTKLDTLTAKAKKILTLTDRTRDIQTILQTRGDLTVKVDAIQQKLPKTVTLDSFSVSQKDVSLTATSQSLTSLQDFLNALSTMVSQKEILQKLTIDSVSANVTTGVYTVNVKGSFL